MTPSLPDDIAARVRRLATAQQQQALAYVRALEQSADAPGLLQFAGTIPTADLRVMAEAIEADCERIDAAGW